MEGNITKILWIAIGALLFVAVVSIAMLMFNQGKEAASNSMEKIASLDAEISESEYQFYNGKVVSGSEVLGAIKKYRSDAGTLMIRVITKNGSNVSYNSDGSLDANGIVTSCTEKTLTQIDSDLVNAQNSAHNCYINPIGEFLGLIRRDANDVIRAIIFTQQ